MFLWGIKGDRRLWSQVRHFELQLERFFKVIWNMFFTVFPVKPWTPEKISGMFIVSRPIRCEMKPQKISRDQSRLDMKQRAGFFFYKKSSIFPLDFSGKAIFWPQTNTSHLIPSVLKPNYRITLKVTPNCENLQRYRSASWVKVSQLQKSTDRKPPITAN